jgi:hypothetical protein
VNRDLTHVAVLVRVTGVCAEGWFSSTLTLAGFAKARVQLQRCDVLFVELVGSLA